MVATDDCERKPRAGQRHTPIPGPVYLSPEWFALRPSIFGASEAAAVCNRSRWEDSARIYSYKTGELPPKKQTPAMKMGHRMEPVIRDTYADETGFYTVGPLGMFIHPTIPYLACTPDAERSDGRLAELKYVRSKDLIEEMGDKESDWVPQEWFLQCQQQLEVMGDELMDLAAIVFGNLRIFTINREPTVIDHIVKATKELHERVLRRDPPEPNWELPGSDEFMKALFGAVDEGGERHLGKEAAAAWIEYKRLGAEGAAIKKRRESLHARVLYGMGEDAIAHVPGYDKLLVRHRIEETEIHYTRKAHVVLRERKP